jgi:hypothetical protein
MKPDETTLKVRAWRAKKAAIEKQYFEQNGISLEILATLPQHELEALMCKNLDNETFGYWLAGAAACDLKGY